MLARLNWLVTTVAILSCWNGESAGEKEEIAAIKKMGGRVELRPLQPGHSDMQATLILSGCKKVDEAVAVLDELAPMVQEANFSDSNLSDAGIKALTKCTKLNTLNIENTQKSQMLASTTSCISVSCTISGLPGSSLHLKAFRSSPSLSD